MLTSLNNALDDDQNTVRVRHCHLCFYIPNDFILGRLYAFRVADLNYLQVSDSVHYAASTLFLVAPLAR